MTSLTQEQLDDFTDLIRRAFPEGLDEETGCLVYSALAGGEVVMQDGRRLHRSWRGTGSSIAEAGAPGDYVNYYLSFLSHDDPEVAPVRERILALDDVLRIESSPRSGPPLYYPDEQGDPEQESGWNLTLVFDREHSHYPRPSDSSADESSSVSAEREDDLGPQSTDH